ncbi:hypothetical protein M8J76_003126 [Diaphorina citri]|nr:hypothetical protein M8J76_003126 [Diaphorina citri]
MLMTQFGMWFSKKYGVDILHLYPVRGHSFNQCDRNFGVFKNSLKNLPVVQNFKTHLTKLVTCRENPSQFTVLMDPTIIKTFKDALTPLFLKKPVTKANTFAIQKYVMMKYKSNGTLLCSRSYFENFIPFRVLDTQGIKEVDSVVERATSCANVYPVVYALMTSRTSTGYQAVLNYVVRPPASLMADFEPALRSVFTRLWPGIDIKGCWFHYTQALWKRAVSTHRLLPLLRRSGEAMRVYDLLNWRWRWRQRKRRGSGSANRWWACSTTWNTIGTLKRVDATAVRTRAQRLAGRRPHRERPLPVDSRDRRIREGYLELDSGGTTLQNYVFQVAGMTEARSWEEMLFGGEEEEEEEEEEEVDDV